MQKTLRNVTRKVQCSIRRTNEFHRNSWIHYFYYKVGNYCFTQFNRVLLTVNLSPVTYLWLCIFREEKTRLENYDFFRRHIDAYHNKGVHLFNDEEDYKTWLANVPSEYILYLET